VPLLLERQARSDVTPIPRDRVIAFATSYTVVGVPSVSVSAAEFAGSMPFAVASARLHLVASQYCASPAKWPKEADA
jgi:hypothetical protein